MSVIKTGTQTFEELPSKRRDTASGSFLVRRWNGDAAQLDAFLTGSLPSGWTDREWEESDGESVMVTATYGVDPDSPTSTPVNLDPISRNWTLVPTRAELSLWAHPKVVAQLDLMEAQSPGLLSQFRKDIEEALEDHTSPDLVPFAGTPVLKAFYTRLLRGEESFITSQQTLRKIETVVQSSQLVAAHTNVNRVFNYGQLVAGEPTLPVAQLIDAANLGSLQWLKQAPEVDQVSRGQWQIIQEYLGFEVIDSWIYQAAS